MERFEVVSLEHRALVAYLQERGIPAHIAKANCKEARIGKQQRKSDFAEFKATYLTPTKLVKRHPVNIEEDVWAQFERIARILGDRGANVGSYINSVLAEHLKLYADDIEIWRKL